jgi:hypothetical protein
VAGRSLRRTAASLGTAPPVGQQAVVFTGYQVRPSGGADPAQDQVWTLIGEFRHAFGPTEGIVMPDESARRFIFGWYAQITQVM